MILRPKLHVIGIQFEGSKKGNLKLATEVDKSGPYRRGVAGGGGLDSCPRQRNCIFSNIVFEFAELFLVNLRSM